MKVLVIGGAGYIGCHVVKELLNNGFEVTVFDNLSTGLRDNLFSKADFIYGNILISSDLEEAFSRGFDAFIHLAAFKAVGESMEYPEKYSKNNIIGTLNIINAAIALNCKNMVFSSTAAVYGTPKYLPVDENHPTNPENYYGFTKLEIQGMIRKVSCTALKEKPSNLLPVIMETACGERKNMQVFGNDWDTRDGTCIRDYIHVSDLARAHKMALEYIFNKKESITLNLGTGHGITVTEMLDAARLITGKEIRAEYVGRRAGDPAVVTAGAKKAYELLGWKAQYSDVETLISSTWRAYRRNIELGLI